MQAWIQRQALDFQSGRRVLRLRRVAVEQFNDGGIIATIAVALRAPWKSPHNNPTCPVCVQELAPVSAQENLAVAVSLQPASTDSRRCTVFLARVLACTATSAALVAYMLTAAVMSSHLPGLVLYAAAICNMTVVWQFAQGCWRGHPRAVHVLAFLAVQWQMQALAKLQEFSYISAAELCTICAPNSLSMLPERKVDYSCAFTALPGENGYCNIALVYDMRFALDLEWLAGMSIENNDGWPSNRTDFPQTKDMCKHIFVGTHLSIVEFGQYSIGDTASDLLSLVMHPQQVMRTTAEWLWHNTSHLAAGQWRDARAMAELLVTLPHSIPGGGGDYYTEQQINCAVAMIVRVATTWIMPPVMCLSLAFFCWWKRMILLRTLPPSHPYISPASGIVEELTAACGLWQQQYALRPIVARCTHND